MKMAFDRSEDVDVFHQLSFVINFFRKELEKEISDWEDKQLDLRVTKEVIRDERREYFAENDDKSYAKRH